MKHTLILLLTVATTLLPRSVFAKDNKDLEKANYYYTHWDYHEAIPYYEKIADGLKDATVYTQLGDCYKATGNLDRAAAWYDKAVKTNGCSTAVMVRYGQVLMQLGKYSDAEKWFKGYQKSLRTPDKRVNNLIAGCEFSMKAADDIPSGTATLETFNTEGSDFAPTLWKGRLVFTSDTVIDLKKKTDNWTGHAYYNIYSVSCDKMGNCGSDFAKVADAKALNIKYHSGPCTFTADGKQMYFTRSKFNDKFFSKKSISNKDSVVLQEIMIATDYDDSAKEFKKVVAFGYNNDDYTVAHPSISPNGKMLVFSSNMPKGAGGSDIYICKKGANDDWAKPQNVGNLINTEGDEVFPYWADDATLYFSSDGHPGFGGLDIFRCTYDEKTGAFSKAENLGAPLNSSYDDISLALLPDGGSTYFSSNRPAQKGSDNIYFYRKEQVFLQVNAIDSLTRQPLTGVKISLDAAKDKRDVADGKSFTRLYPEMQYAVKLSKDSYDPAQLSVSTANVKETDTITLNVALYSKPVVQETPPPPPPPPTAPSFTKVVGTPEVNKVYEIGHFYFEYAKSDLSPEAKLGLDSLSEYLVHNPKMHIQVRAHTDCRGGDAYNMKLSKKRADAVVAYLTKKGIAAKRLDCVGLGSRYPVVKCPICEKCTEDDHFKNRVLEFKILKI